MSHQHKSGSELAQRHFSARAQSKVEHSQSGTEAARAPLNLLQLQRMIGNQAVQRLLGEKSSDAPNGRIQKSPMPDISRVAPKDKTIPETNVTYKDGLSVEGDPNFYANARQKNQYYASNPPKPGWPYSDYLKSLWKAGKFNEFADEVMHLQAFTYLLPADHVDGVLGPTTAEQLTKKPAPASDTTTNSGGGMDKSPLDMTVAEFEASPAAQQELFKMAKETRERQQKFAISIISGTKSPGNATSILKRDDFDAFVKGVIEKCKRKGYARIGQMDDIVRGRFNLDMGPDVEKVAIALQNQKQFEVTTVERPRRPIDMGFGYPRWHVVIRDTNGITHEWQVGTQAVTDVYEKRGIVIPPAVGKLPEGMHNDIHDIEYDILRRIQEDHPAIASDVGIPAFRNQVDVVSSVAGREGKLMADKDERITTLHDQCSAILEKLVAKHGPEIIRKYFKR